MRAGEIFGVTLGPGEPERGIFPPEKEGDQDRRGAPCLFQRRGKGGVERLSKVRNISHNLVFTYKGKQVHIARPKRKGLLLRSL